MIRFLFKLCVLLCLIFIGVSYFMPVKPNQPIAEQTATDQTAAEAAGIWVGAKALGALIADMDGFCARNPQSCETGKSLFGAMAARAGRGAALAYQWVGAGLHKGAENTEQHLNAAAAPAPQAQTAAAGRPQPAGQDNIAAPVKETEAEPAPAKAAKAEPAKAAAAGKSAAAAGKAAAAPNKTAAPGRKPPAKAAGAAKMVKAPPAKAAKREQKPKQDKTAAAPKIGRRNKAAAEQKQKPGRLH